MANDSEEEAIPIPPARLDPADRHILEFLRKRGPTYHINISKELAYDIQYVSRRCKYLASHDLLDRQSLTYYALTEYGERFLEDTSTDDFSGQTVKGG